jgi:hypothetical protein
MEYSERMKEKYGIVDEEAMYKIPIDEMIAQRNNIGPYVINSIPFYLMGKLLGTDYLDESTITALKGKEAALPDEYTILAILSGNIDDPENRNLFWVYPSRSELGLWRLCFSLSDNTPGYDKLSFVSTVQGDYIQSTLIHLELQKFINENISNVVVYNGPGGVFNEELENKIVPYGLMYKTLRYDMGHTISCDLFNNSDTALVNLVDPLNRQINPTSPPFDIKLDECGSLENSRHYNPTMKTLYSDLEIFSNSFKSNYKIGENVPIITDYSATIKLSGRYPLEVFVLGDIYSVTLLSKVPNQAEPDLNELTLIYLRTKKMENLPEFEDNTGDFYDPNDINYYMPIALLPSTAECNKYGIYSRYIYAGNYICKLFDYSKQCTKDETNKYYCTTNYTFIGNRYLNLFPYKEIQERMTNPRPPVVNEPEPPVETEPPVESLAGGLRRSIKRKNKRRTTKKRRATRKRRKTHKKKRGSRRR